MIDTIKKLLGLGTTLNYSMLVKQGAIILDVRTKNEYASGHIKGSINISVDALAHNLDRLKDKNQPIITCCASGMRSGSAKGILKSKGYSQVHNGGGWGSLEARLQRGL